MRTRNVWCIVLVAMHIKAGLLSLTVLSAFSLMASCGGSSESNDNKGGAGGGTSTAGKGSGGKAGSTATAGTGTGTGGAQATGGSGSGGSGPSGGRPATGGTFNFGGAFDFGGAPFDPSDFMCDPVPEAGSDCAAGAQPCVAGTSVCYCQAMKWTCSDFSGGFGGAGPDFGELDCPATKPMSGTPCGDQNGYCQFGQGSACACYNGDWACL
jgi:hypothetical protein